ncbi:hypothetical protein SLA2020_519700 [Shorea laevis]
MISSILFFKSLKLSGDKGADWQRKMFAIFFVPSSSFCYGRFFDYLLPWIRQPTQDAVCSVTISEKKGTLPFCSISPVNLERR